jgi:uncharacterized membrane protein YeaQ/YmgE (transglycosylase-associated protein family)
MDLWFAWDFMHASQAHRIVRLQSFRWLLQAKHANVPRCLARIKGRPRASGEWTAACKWSEVMALEALIIFLIIGAIAGWLAGQIMAGGGFGLIGNIVLGIVGAFVAGFLLPNFFPLGGIVGSIIHAAIGAVIVLLIVGLIKRA